MRRVMGTGVHATGFCMLRAQVAGCRLILGDHDLAPREIFGGHRERMHADIPVRAILRAQPAADAPVFDDDLERLAATDRSHRTAHHAQRVAALTAGSRHQEVFEAQSFTNQPRDTVVRVGAGTNARVAASALFKIQNQQALGLHEALRQKPVEGNIRGLFQALPILFQMLRSDLFQAAPDFGEGFHHTLKVFGCDANHLG